MYYMPQLVDPAPTVDSAKPVSKLSPRQKAFIHHYIVLKNGAKACQAAGYTGKYLNTTAYHLLRNATIRREIDETLKWCDWDKPEYIKRTKEIFFDTKQDGSKLKALELIGKAQNFLGESSINVNLGIFGNEIASLVKQSSTISGMSDGEAELLEGNTLHTSLLSDIKPVSDSANESPAQ